MYRDALGCGICGGCNGFLLSIGAVLTFK